jgi:fructoselysine-6-P-deglycase FrlB-like protein
MTPAESRALMHREIVEQSAIVSRAAGPLAEAAASIRLDRDRPLWVGGCGDSLFAPQALALHFRRRGWDIRPSSAAEMLWDADIRAGDAVVGISISGSTRRTVEAVEKATRNGAHTVAVTLDPGSPLARAARDVLVLPFEPISRAIPHGLDYHVTLLALAALAGGHDADPVVEMLARDGMAALEAARETASGLSRETRFFFLGGGAAMGSANYGAAKMHEAGGLPAWSFETENFGHGAQFMLRPGDHAVLCGGGGPADARTEAVADGFARLGVSVSRAGLPASDDALLSGMRTALACQALCLAVAERFDLDVTDPGRGSLAAEVQRGWFGWTSA